jgi:glycosyltransferase involved in cell wall biosynthesis
MAELDDNAPQQAPRSVLVIADDEFVADYSPVLRHLAVGLLDEAISMTLVGPEPAESIQQLAPVTWIPLGATYWPARSRTVRRLGEVLKDPPTLVHCLSLGACKVGGELARLFDVPFLVSFTDLADAASVRRLDSKHCAGLIAHHALIEDSLRRRASIHGIDPVVYVPIGVHLADPPLAPEGDRRARQSLLARGDLEVGRGFEELITAFGALVKQDYDLLLFLIGAGPSEPSLRKLARQNGVADRVTFAAPIAGSQVLSAGADVYVQAGSSGRIQLETLEAMSAGLPILAASEEGSLSMISHERDGLEFASKGAEDLVLQLKRLFDDTQLANRLGEAARETVHTHHLASRMVGDLIGFYCKIMLRESTLPIPSA